MQVFLRLFALAAVCVLFAGILTRSPDPVMDEAAQAFLDVLSEDAQRRALWAFDDDERYNWHFVPRRREGLPLSDMNEEQRKSVHVLLRSSLSAKGYKKATDVMELEGILGVLEGNTGHRDPERYYVTIFGMPSSSDPWGWRFEGHHLSLNFLSVGSMGASGTPAFMGANPSDHKGLRVLGAEEDAARTLMRALDVRQHAQAVIATRAPRDIITGADRHARLDLFEGLAASAMTTQQQALLMALVEEYTHNMQPEMAEAAQRQLEGAGTDNLYFAWAGSLQQGEGHYYRIHGPTLLIEYDNTQGGANHVHSVLRAFDNDFGEDLLRKHYEENHPDD